MSEREADLDAWMSRLSSGDRSAFEPLYTALGIASVAILRCSTPFLGEAFGLLGGLIAGVAGAALAQSVLRRRPA